MTSIEWLISRLAINNILDHKKLSEDKRMYNLYLRLKAQAKEMHKQEILQTSKDSYISGYIDNQCKFDDSMKFPNEYYEETFVSKGSDEIPMERKLLKSGFVDIVPKQEKHIVDTNEMVDQVPDVRKMVEDTFKVWECCGMEECICKGNDVEKLAEEEYPIFDGDLLGIAHNQQNSRIDFIKGYNKAKETLYTEEQVREAMLQISEYYANNLDKQIDGHKKALEIIQSLKQPKK